MLNNLKSSFVLALANIRSNFFHTLLSVLGIVIGVGALVSILSLIEGMEQFARAQVSQTTSVNAIVIRSITHKTINNVRVAKDSVSVLGYPNTYMLWSNLGYPAKVYWRSNFNTEVRLNPTTPGIGVQAYALGAISDVEEVVVGRNLNVDDIKSISPVVVVNQSFLDAQSIKKSDPLQQRIYLMGKELSIVGVAGDGKTPTPKAYLPLSILSEREMKEHPPEVFLEAAKTEDIPALRKEISDRLQQKFPRAQQDFDIITNDSRVDQVAKGFLLFRIIMGLIVGISVVVGGIGVMNVLLISVNERTREIGIRKAMGATRRDIVLLFLAESITVSGFGSIIGVIFGVAFTMVAIPIVKALTKIPFQAAYTANTFIVISAIAVFVGIVFGTYPAMRASRLNPVDAIRHE
ncbi:MAG TPA: ABC transporter permease [Cyclobacteriaceae bacterium]|nr:ABC transporter permease [Cyclobacteriaceae bacterium]